MEKSEKEIMLQPPRSKTTTLFTKELIMDTFIYGSIMGGLSLASFILTSIADGPWQSTYRCYTYENMDTLCKGIYAAR